MNWRADSADGRAIMVKAESADDARRAAAAELGCAPDKVQVREFRRLADLRGVQFTLGPGVMDLLDLRRRLEAKIGNEAENAWSTATYDRAHAEVGEAPEKVVQWVTDRYTEALARIDAGGSL